MTEITEQSGENTFKFPTHVNVLGQDFDIEYVEDMREVDAALDRSDLLGQAGNAIRIYCSGPAAQTFMTLLHELLHVFFFRLPLLGAAVRQSAGEEAFVDTLANAVADTLLRNRWIKLDEEVHPTVVRLPFAGGGRSIPVEEMFEQREPDADSE